MKCKTCPTCNHNTVKAGNDPNEVHPPRKCAQCNCGELTNASAPGWVSFNPKLYERQGHFSYTNCFYAGSSSFWK